MARGVCTPICGSLMVSRSTTSAWSGLWPATGSRAARAPAAAPTIRVEGVRVAPDLVERDFNPTAPNRTWSADITYIRTWEGWLYLAHVQDLFSRRIVGWAMTDHLRQELVIDALQMAISRRKPGPGVIHHSDQGSQYTAVL